MSEKPKKSDIKAEEMEPETIEEGFKLLEEILKRLSDEGISLEDSFREYEKGMKLIKSVSEKIDRVEKKVRILNGEEEDDIQ